MADSAHCGLPIAYGGQGIPAGGQLVHSEFKPGDVAAQLNKALENGLLSQESCYRIMQEYVHMNVNPAVFGQGVASGVNHIDPLDQFKSLGEQVRVACWDPTRDHFVAKSVNTPTEWLDAMGSGIKALQTVMEYLAAQDALDIWVNKPLEKRIYSRIIEAGIRSLMGVK